MKKKQKVEIIEKKNQISDFDFASFLSTNETDFGVKGVLKEFINEKEVRTKTRLGVNEINIVSRAHSISDFLSSKNLNQSANLIRSYYNNVLALRISLNGLSREELIRAMQSELQRQQQENQKEQIRT